MATADDVRSMETLQPPRPLTCCSDAVVQRLPALSIPLDVEAQLCCVHRRAHLEVQAVEVGDGDRRGQAQPGYAREGQGRLSGVQ